MSSWDTAWSFLNESYLKENQEAKIKGIEDYAKSLGMDFRMTFVFVGSWFANVAAVSALGLLVLYEMVWSFIFGHQAQVSRFLAVAAVLLMAVNQTLLTVVITYLAELTTNLVFQWAALGLVAIGLFLDVIWLTDRRYYETKPTTKTDWV